VLFSLKLQYQAVKPLVGWFHPTFFGGLLNETLSFSSVKLDGSPAEASVQFELYTPGKLESMLQGDMGPLGSVTQGVLMGTSILMAIPSLMVFLSIALPARPNRILNIIVGTFFTLLLALMTYAVDWYFYKFFAAIETTLTALVVWYAWNWPKMRAPLN